MQLESVLPGVRGDNNQLMQVFFNIINNARGCHERSGRRRADHPDAARSRQCGDPVFRYGAGNPRPHRVFDPFYTTKPVGKGTGLGLSICYGILQEHGGRYLCYNGQTGGAVFRVELPAVLAALPGRGPQAPGATPVPSS